MDSVVNVQLMKHGTEVNAFVSLVSIKSMECAELVILIQLIIAEIVFAIMVSMEMLINVSLAILVAVNVQGQRQINA